MGIEHSLNNFTKYGGKHPEESTKNQQNRHRVGSSITGRGCYNSRTPHQRDVAERVVGLLRCPNHNCITAENEPVASKFDVLPDGVRCAYCETIVREDIASHLET